MIETVAVTRRICPAIFLLDISGSMSGAPIGAVNAAMETIVQALRDMNRDSNADAKMKMAILTFSTDINWITGDELVDPEDFTWRDLDTDGITNMGEAIKELNNALSVSHGIMDRATGSLAPVLFLLSDGAPSDVVDFDAAIAELKQNNWYKFAVKTAIGYGNSVDRAVLENFTSNPGTVIQTDDPASLAKLIEFVSITSSMVASSGGDTIGGTKADDNTSRLADEFKLNPPTINTDPDDALFDF
jgi:uncharacterized protein YegL